MVEDEEADRAHEIAMKIARACEGKDVLECMAAISMVQAYMITMLSEGTDDGIEKGIITADKALRLALDEEGMVLQ